MNMSQYEQPFNLYHHLHNIIIANQSHLHLLMINYGCYKCYF
jgi:hypothetical protein